MNNLDRISWSCVNCSDIFYGCMLCDNAYQCKQCQRHLYAMNGYCYQAFSLTRTVKRSWSKSPKIFLRKQKNWKILWIFLKINFGLEDSFKCYQHDAKTLAGRDSEPNYEKVIAVCLVILVVLTFIWLIIFLCCMKRLAHKQKYTSVI